jgi:hypothetical protein
MPSALLDSTDTPATGNQTSPQPDADHDALDPTFTDDLLHSLAVALPSPDQETRECKARRLAAAVVVLRSLDAQQPVEAMLATHAVLAHHFALECYRRAATSSQTAELNTSLLGTAAMLSRTLGATVQALRNPRDVEPIWCGSRDTPFPQR